jgi:Arc/MetJ family transcription regulator
MWCILPIGDIAMGRTNIVIDDALIDEAMKVTGARTKREAVDIALRQVVDRRRLYRAIRKCRGKLPWAGDLRAWRSARA